MNLQDQFNPIKAIQTLKDNAVEIQKLGESITEKRILLSLSKARLADKEKELRDEVFGGLEIQATKLSDWMKWKKATEQKEVDTLSDEIKIAEGKLNILIEINNTVKFSYKIYEMEMKGLNYTQPT